MLKIEKLTYKINNKEILKEINLYINNNEIVGLIGKNGAGKTTLLESICRIRKKQTGSISIEGTDYEKKEYSQNVVFVSDDPYLYNFLTGEEYINLFLHLYAIKIDMDRLKHLAKRLELSTHLQKLIKTYSKGMRMKLALLGALMINPKLLLMDEPFNGLDPTSIFILIDILKEFAIDGGTVFFSSHSLDYIKTLCSRVYFLQDGFASEVELKSMEELFYDKEA